MKPLKLFLSSIPLTCFATMLFAQFDMPKYKDVEALKNRQLIVVVTQQDDDLMKKIDKKGTPELMEQYKKILDYYNSNMKAAVEKLWDFNSKDVLYKSPDELDEIIKDKSERDKYVIMYTHSFFHNLIKKHDIELRIDKDVHGVYQLYGALTFFSISFPNESPFYDVMLSTLVPSARETAWAVSTANYNFNYVYNHKSNCDMKAMIDENAYILKQKNLLLLKDEVSPTVVNDIGKYYPGNVKLVDLKEMLNAIVNADSTCAYVIWTEYNTNNGAGTDWIVNCADGATLAHRRTGMGAYFHGDRGYKKDFFEDMAEFYNAGGKK